VHFHLSYARAVASPGYGPYHVPPRIIGEGSERGSQYTSVKFGKRCREVGLKPSMGSVGGAYDNAVAESFLATSSGSSRPPPLPRSGRSQDGRLRLDRTLLHRAAGTPASGASRPSGMTSGTMRREGPKPHLARNGGSSTLTRAARSLHPSRCNLRLPVWWPEHIPADKSAHQNTVAI
jgi:transposase InsO family protein